jgi:hypothetical protein
MDSQVRRAFLHYTRGERAAAQRVIESVLEADPENQGALDLLWRMQDEETAQTKRRARRRWLCRDLPSGLLAAVLLLASGGWMFQDALRAALRRGLTAPGSPIYRSRGGRRDSAPAWFGLLNALPFLGLGGYVLLRLWQDWQTAHDNLAE